MAEPTQYRPERSESDQSEDLGAGAVRPQGVGAQQVGPEAAGPEAAGPEAAGPEAIRPEAAGSEASRPEAARSEAAGPEAAGPGVSRSGLAAQQGAKAVKAQARRPERPRTRTRVTEGRREETRQRILTAAGQLFREHGIDGIGVDAVMKQAGLTHGGFYLHFPSKESLAAEVSQSLLEKAAAQWDEISRSPDQEAALEQIVRHYLNPTRVASAHCCPLTTLGPDVARRSASRSAIGGALRGMLDALARLLPGRLLPGRRRQAALASLSTMVGAVVLSRLADDPALADAFLQAAADSILPARRASNRMELFTEQRAPD
jgi:TetR/AcrR family transcriptional regulator, transcriptional repressor for nem operon